MILAIYIYIILKVYKDFFAIIYNSLYLWYFLLFIL